MRRGGLRFLYLLYFPSYDVINDVIMSDADCIPGREPRSVAASYQILSPCDNLCTTYLLPNFVDFVDSVTDR